MAKRKQPPGTWVLREMIKSAAFLGLIRKAPHALLVFLSKRQFQLVGRNGKKSYRTVNGEDITFSYLEAEEKYGISKKQFSNAIDQLLERGFIKIVHLGGRCRTDQTVYGLSEEWRTWTPGQVCETRPVSETRGWRKKKKNATRKGSLKSRLRFPDGKSYGNPGTKKDFPKGTPYENPETLDGESLDPVLDGLGTPEV